VFIHFIIEPIRIFLLNSTISGLVVRNTISGLVVCTYESCRNLQFDRVIKAISRYQNVRAWTVLTLRNSSILLAETTKLHIFLGSAIRDTRYACQPTQYVNTSRRSTLVCQYALPFRGPYGLDLTQASVSLSQSAHCDQ